MTPHEKAAKKAIADGWIRYENTRLNTQWRRKNIVFGAGDMENNITEEEMIALYGTPYVGMIVHYPSGRSSTIVNVSSSGKLIKLDTGLTFSRDSYGVYRRGKMWLIVGG